MSARCISRRLINIYQSVINTCTTLMPVDCSSLDDASSQQKQKDDVYRESAERRVIIMRWSLTGYWENMKCSFTSRTSSSASTFNFSSAVHQQPAPHSIFACIQLENSSRCRDHIFASTSDKKTRVCLEVVGHRRSVNKKQFVFILYELIELKMRQLRWDERYLEDVDKQRHNIGELNCDGWLIDIELMWWRWWQWWLNGAAK
jgi:hypothetical protein